MQHTAEQGWASSVKGLLGVSPEGWVSNQVLSHNTHAAAAVHAAGRTLSRGRSLKKKRRVGWGGAFGWPHVEDVARRVPLPYDQSAVLGLLTAGLVAMSSHHTCGHTTSS